MSIKEFAEKYIEAQHDAFMNGNFDTLEALEDPEVVLHIGPSQEIEGFEAHKQDILKWREAVSDLQYKTEYLIGDNNLCVLTTKEKAKVTKEVPGFPIQVGTIYNIDDVITILRLADGKIKEVWVKTSMVQIER